MKKELLNYLKLRDQTSRRNDLVARLNLANVENSNFALTSRTRLLELPEDTEAEETPFALFLSVSTDYDPAAQVVDVRNRELRGWLDRGKRVYEPYPKTCFLPKEQ
ncbi:MAG: hypothetical protein QGG73_05375 [Candidatus Hydrogenedentes bacterium]|jgi:hypothetical protein|nr:hypothetical protein [Candidatus Hydrogenedentota bacterium]